MDDTDVGRRSHVSTGRLPNAEEVQRLLIQAHAQVAGASGGEVSTVYPALARVSEDLFGICVGAGRRTPSRSTPGSPRCP